jgi:hypothetical protein
LKPERIIRSKELTSMEVNDNLQARSPGPSNGVIQIFELALDKWLVIRGTDSPIANGNPDMIQTRCGDPGKIIGSNPALPVR